ncbi:MAG TPA: dihydrofolate reductase family protein, partial [Solirubrobacteraceae bacterium]|nr:dihydrofolate reductase family protein [Solirubrobacteraceae bacterium]
MEGTPYRRLAPAGPDTDALSYTEGLELCRAAPDRPYVLANFVMSVDGATTVAERSRRLSGPADRELFYALRERVDAVLVGPRTLAAERYKRMLPAAERRERRRATGRPAEPLAVTVTRSGQVPREIPLFRDAPDRVLVLDGDGVPLDAVLHTLRRDHGVTTLLCEGGPTLFGALLRARLVDEL